MRVLALVVAALFLYSGAAVAQQPNEMSVQLVHPGEFQVWINDTLPEEHWSDIRIAADQDQNGHVSDAEAAEFEEATRLELENHPSERTTLNGETVANVSASFHAEGLRGPVSDTGPVIGRAAARMEYPIDDDPETLEWERVPFEDENGRTYAMIAPPGWVVASHSGLVDADTSVSNSFSKVTGTIGDETLTIILVPEDAYEEWSREQSAAADEDPEHRAGDDASHAGSSDEEEAEGAVEVAAPGVFLMVAGLVALLGLKRRR